jgi:hypothetical protein
VLASGGDTRFLLIANLTGTYLFGLPIAAGLGLFAKFGFFGVFSGKILEEVVKAACFFFRFRSSRWYANGLKEAREELKREPRSGSGGSDSPENQISISCNLSNLERVTHKAPHGRTENAKRKIDSSE